MDLATVKPSVAGPKRPQDRIELTQVKEKFQELLLAPSAESGYGKSLSEANRRFIILTGVGGGKATDLPLTGGGEQGTGDAAGG